MIVAEFSNLFDRLKDPVLVFSNDTIVYLNPAAKDLFGNLADTQIHEFFGESGTVTLNGAVYEVTISSAFEHDIYYLSPKNPLDDLLYHASARLKNKLAELKLTERLLTPILESLGDEKISAYSASLSKTVTVLHRMVGNLGFFQSFDKTSFCPMTFDLSQVIGDIADSIPVFVGENCPSIVFECADGDMTVQADKSKIELALFQILSNSLKHTEKGGKITIKLLRTDKSFTVIITDTGCGMSTKQLASVWLPGNAEITPNGGIGIGLPITQHIAALHGGHALISSDAGGTSVSLTIPAVQSGADDLGTLSAQYDSGLSDLMLQLSEVIPTDHFCSKFTD